MPLSNQDKSNVEALRETAQRISHACLEVRRELENAFHQAGERGEGWQVKLPLQEQMLEMAVLRSKWEMEIWRLDNVKSPGHLQFMIQRLELEQASA